MNAHSSTGYNDQKVETTPSPSRISTWWCIPTVGNPSDIKRNDVNTISACHNVGKVLKDYVNSKKPDIKCHILYDPIYVK